VNNPSNALWSSEKHHGWLNFSGIRTDPDASQGGRRWLETGRREILKPFPNAALCIIDPLVSGERDPKAILLSSTPTLHPLI
jgi:hypothetical protein